MEQGIVLVVDDEKSQRDILKTILEDEGYDVEVSANASNALNFIKERSFDIILTDLKMPGSDGIDLLQKVLNKNTLMCVIIMTAHGTIDTAVEAMKRGAFDYLTKPLERDELLLCLKRAFEKIRLVKENEMLHQELNDRFRIDNIIGNHGKMREVFKIIKRLPTRILPCSSAVKAGQERSLLRGQFTLTACARIRYSLP